MLKAARGIFRRFGFVGGLVLALALAMSAAEGHACTGETAGSGQIAVANALDHGDACADCGPACAAACCHAQHMAIAADPPSFRPTAVRPCFQRTSQGDPASVRPPDPDRPPRL